jgi:hypothetical protein
MHRWIAAPMWRYLRPFAFDWLWFFAVLMVIEKSWSPTAFAAASIGAVVLGIVGLTLAGILTLLPGRSINFAWVAISLFFGFLLATVFREKLPPGLIGQGMSLAEWTPFHPVAGKVISAMDHDLSGWLGMGIAAAACAGILALSWRISAAKFDPYIWESDAGLSLMAPAEAKANPESPATDDVRAALSAELRRPPGSATAARGWLERRFVAMAKPETRRLLDLLDPAGKSWGTSWIIAAALTVVAFLTARVFHVEIARFIMLYVLFIAIAPYGRQWMLMRPWVAGNLRCHLWVALPIGLRSLGWVILRVAHLRLLLALPILAVAVRIFFKDGWALQTMAGVLACAVAAVSLGVVFHWTESVPAFGPNANVNFKRIFAVLGFCLVLLALVMILFMASPPVALAAGAALIGIGHLTRILLTRRIDRGVYDFV